jgi:hypothetical protein
MVFGLILVINWNNSLLLIKNGESITFPRRLKKPKKPSSLLALMTDP